MMSESVFMHADCGNKWQLLVAFRCLEFDKSLKDVPGILVIIKYLFPALV